MQPILAILIGVVAGCLVNYLSDVLPTQRRLSRPVCPDCGAVFRWPDYFLTSACRECRHPRSWRTYLVLVAGPILSLLLWLAPPPQWNAFPQAGYWVGLLVLTYFGVVMVIDLEHRLILHVVSLVGAGIGLLAGVLAHGWIITLLGGAVGLAIMLAFYLGGALFARYRARKRGVDDGEEALGFGDVILSTILGLMLGWPLIATGLLIGVLVGGLFSLLLILILVSARRFESMNVFTAYGPYLIFSASLLLFLPQFSAFFAGR